MHSTVGVKEQPVGAGGKRPRDGSQDAAAVAPATVVEKMEGRVYALLDMLVDDDAVDPLCFSIRKRAKSNIALDMNEDDRGTLKLQQEMVCKEWSEKSGGGPYTQMWELMGMIYKLKRTNKTAAQRELYYSLCHAFTSQSVCNNAILDVGCLLGVDRSDLGVFASSKGYFTGCIEVDLDGSGTW
jgi:DNA topoisomerase VI subunit A